MSTMYDLIFVAAISFLVGFKIAAWMGKRHLERMRKIWGIRDTIRFSASD